MRKREREKETDNKREKNERKNYGVRKREAKNLIWERISKIKVQKGKWERESVNLETRWKEMRQRTKEKKWERKNRKLRER